MRLSDGISFVVDAELEEFGQRVRSAIDEGQWVAVENERGVTHVYIEPLTATVPAGVRSEELPSASA
jgi:hypothetical protein